MRSPARPADTHYRTAAPTLRYQEAARAAQTFINRTSDGSHTVNPWPEANLHNDDYYVLTLVPPEPNDQLLTVSKTSGKVEWLPAPPSDPDPLGELFPVVVEPEPEVAHSQPLQVPSLGAGGSSR